METLCYRLLIILLDPDEETDENRGKIDVGDHDLVSTLDTSLSSSSQSPFSPDDAGNEHNEEKLFSETKVVYGTTAIMEVAYQILAKCRNNYDVYCDKNGPAFMIAVPPYREVYAKLRSNGVRIRLITEITADNLECCKKVIDKLTADVKHLAGVKGNFAISDEKIYVGTTTLEEDKPVPDLIYSNTKGIIEQNLFLFNSLWEKAIPAEQRIREIEQGFLPVETRIVNNPDEIYSLILDIISKSNNGMSNYSTIGGFRMIYEDKNLFHAYADLVSRYKQGKAKRGVRWITHIENNKEQIDLINKFLNIGIEIRHTNNPPPMSFAISDKQFQGTIERMEHGKMFNSVLYSTESLYIKHFQLLFEDVWRNAIDAQKRMAQIEAGIASENTRVIENTIESKNLFLEILENAQEEILLIFPSLRSLKRKSEIGLFSMLKLKDADRFRIRILSPDADTVKEVLLLEYSKDNGNKINNVAIREIAKQQKIGSFVLLADRKNVLTIEVKDDHKETFEEATDLATYSTSAPTVSSYLSLFETLWEKTEMYDNLRIANERIVTSEHMEREFINTAAHELRTPTQAIMGYTELDFELFDDIMKDIKLYENEGLKRNLANIYKHYDAISRNTTRLNDLINNLLDVARIESNRLNSLQLHKEPLDLIKEIKESINTQLDQKIKDKNIQINFINQMFEEQFSVNADKSRLNQILTNLIDNAIKFSPLNSIIDIIIKDNNSDLFEGKVKEYYLSKQKPNNSGVLIGISDRGKGISPEIMPKLFEKFVTDSDFGTGLGLYITKNLVEAHGGKIWAFNNNDGIGSTFVFSLPKIDNRILYSN